MPSKYDIFISYGHLDDEDPAGDVKGWVDLLVERLPRLVSSSLGYLPKVWRDQRSLTGDALLRAAIEEGLSQSLLFVPIVTPRYVQSDWCLRELEAFSKNPPLPNAPAHRSRIFKVIKSPLLFHLAKKEPPQLRELIGHSFYEMEGDMPVEFSPDVVPSKDPRYWTALRRLAWDMSTLLAAVKDPDHHSTTKELPAEGPKKFIYLAETSSDLAQEREVVRDELQQRGYGVLPEEKLPTTELQETEGAILKALGRSILSVHLIGKRYGASPEDDPRSTVAIQEDVAAQRCAKDPSFTRLLWMPLGLMTPALEVTDERQKTFITAVQNRIGTGAELLQTSIEDLKTRIIEKLNPPAPVETTKQNGRSKLKQVYLICENRDRSLVRPIKEYLFKQNLEVITWLDGDSAATLMDYHRKNLRECDAALVYFGSGDVPWADKNLDDLEKAYGYGREQDWVSNAIYVGPPDSEQKERFRSIRTEFFIRNFKSVDPNELRDFVSAVKAAEGGMQ